MPKSVVSKLALLIAVAGGSVSASLPSPATAAGFTGSFAAGNWNLYSYLDDPGYPVDKNVTTPTTQQAYNAYLCNTNLANCIANDFDEAAGYATLIGSNYDEHGTSDNQSWVTQWELDPYTGSSPYTINFKWDYFTLDGTSDDQSYYYTFDTANPANVAYFPLSSNTSDNGVESVVLQTGWRLGFGIHTVQNSGGPGYLTISQFDFPTEVPGPLPLFGAAAAFGWSRRLRQRQRNASDQLIRL